MVGFVPVLVVGTAGELPLLGKYKGYLHEYKDQHGVMDAAAGSRLVTETGDLERVTLEMLTQMQTGRPARRRSKCRSTSWPARPPSPRRRPPGPARRPRRGDHPAHRHAPAGGQLSAALRRRGRRSGPGWPTTSCWSWPNPAGRRAVLDQWQGRHPRFQLWSAGCTWRTSSGPADGYPEAWRKADAGLVVGSRLTGMSTRAWRLPLPQPLAHLDIDASEMGKSYPVTERLVGDARTGLRARSTPSGSLEAGASRWQGAEIRAARDADDAAGEAKCPEALAIVRALVKPCRRESWPATRPSPATGPYATSTSGPRRFLYPAGSAALGFGLPVGIGAQVAAPGSRVCVLAGDGGFLFTGTELATAVQYELPLAIVVCNDNAYGMIKSGPGAQLRRPGDRHRAAQPGLRRLRQGLRRPRRASRRPPGPGRRAGGGLGPQRPSLLVMDIKLAPPFH